MFASETKETVDYKGVEVVIRKLSARSLDKANEVRQITAGQLSRSLGPELIKAFREDAGQKSDEQPKDAAEEPDTPEARAERLKRAEEARYSQYDRTTVLTAGIVSWKAPVKVQDGIADLEEEAAEFLHRAILKLSLPPLDPAVVEAERAKP